MQRDPGRALIRPEVDPRGVELHAAASVAGERQPPGRGDRRACARPRSQLDPVVLERRRLHVDPDAADDPEVAGRAPAGLVDVVDRDVLEVARDRVQAQAAVRRAVGEPDAAARVEDTACGRERDERFQARQPTA